MKRIYIAGPMSGLPESNYPAFNAKAAELRSQGHHVENPAENPVPPCGSWLGYMRMALAQLATCEAIYMLPGWQGSRGAAIEYQLARSIGLEMMGEIGGAPVSGGALGGAVAWFREAVPVPQTSNVLSQLGCHFEEVCEMVEAVQGVEASEDAEGLWMFAESLKQGAVNPTVVAGFEHTFLPQIDRRALLDALCDQIVTAIGVAHMMGMDIEGAMAEVNRANWSKFVNGRPVFDARGKIAKGPQYAPPELASFVGDGGI